MCDLFLMPAMLAISDKYRISKTIAGVFIALSVSIAEVFFSVMSFQRHGTKNTEFGLACVFGGAAFSYTAIPAVAYFINFGIMTKRPEQPNDLKFQLENLRFRNGFIRDMSFCLLSCLVYFLEMDSGSISLLGAIWQLSIFAVYVLSIWLMDDYHTTYI